MGNGHAIMIIIKLDAQIPTMGGKNKAAATTNKTTKSALVGSARLGDALIPALSSLHQHFVFLQYECVSLCNIKLL